MMMGGFFGWLKLLQGMMFFLYIRIFVWSGGEADIFPEA